MPSRQQVLCRMFEYRYLCHYNGLSSSWSSCYNHIDNSWTKCLYCVFGKWNYATINGSVVWANENSDLTSRWFSPGTPVSSTNKTGLHDIIEILLKVALNTITLTPFKRPVCSNHLVSVYYTYCNQNFHNWMCFAKGSNYCEPYSIIWKHSFKIK
jgi:hypothetical protein